MSREIRQLWKKVNRVLRDFFGLTVKQINEVWKWVQENPQKSIRVLLAVIAASNTGDLWAAISVISEVLSS